MAATQTPIEIVQGATYKMSVTWTDGGTPPVSKSLVGFYAHMQLRPKLGAVGTPLLDLSSNETVAADGTVVPPAILLEPLGVVGVVAIRISAVLTEKLAKPCFYDLFLINVADPSESVRLIAGPVTIDLSVTINA